MVMRIGSFEQFTERLGGLTVRVGLMSLWTAFLSVFDAAA